jgi:histidinol-phosphatase
MNPEWRTRYELAMEVARNAGDLARGYFDGQVEVELKADQSPVTVADRNAEALVREQVAYYFPQDGFLGEEHGDQPGGSGFRWVIDPIDGTKAFIRGVPLWGTLVGLEYKGEQIAGVAYGAALGQMHHALRGEGAFRDGKRIRVSDTDKISESTLCYSGTKWFRKSGRDAGFQALAYATAQQRGWGDYYGFVLVAQGSVEMMLDYGVHIWDVAALKPIVEEAGGTFTDWTGTPTVHTPDCLASNGKVHAEALKILTS